MGEETRTNTEEIEVWEGVIGYEGLYEVSTLGRIRRTADSRSELLSPHLHRFLYGRVKGEYPAVGLSKNGKVKERAVHILVALAFVPNPYNKPIVNHLDGDKMNPLASNLEWATISENTLHAIRMGLIVNPEKNFGIIARPYELNGRARKVYQYDYNGNFIKEWGCIKKASDFLGVSETVVRAAANGEQNHAGGFVWSFEDKFPGFEANPNNGIPQPVEQYDLNGVSLNRYASATEAARKVKGTTRQGIGKACLGKYKSCGGYLWKFEKKS